jgi:dTDP-L-rhamnose 4-epimerase
MKHILITGGAGFIGSHLADELLNCGYEVRILDNLTPQVHGFTNKSPDYLPADIEFIYGDVRNSDVVKKALEGIDAIFHFAAAVGVGQSMYEVEHYTSVNSMGTSVLCQSIIDGHHNIEKLVTASSMSIYGEGLYHDNNKQIRTGIKRDFQYLKNSKWELYDEKGNVLKPIATTENKQPDLSSIYALSKYDQEKMCLIIGNAYNIPAVALRFFNVFGTRQSLSNPYTGVLAIFASRLINDNPPLIFEDGNQKRDFVNVKDVARACRLAMENPKVKNTSINIGSGQSYTIREIASMLASVLNKDIEPVLTGKYRVGDIRHCFADISYAKKILGYSPKITLNDGLKELSKWLSEQTSKDDFEIASQQLGSRGLTI